jgi:hypothetical protein
MKEGNWMMGNAEFTNIRRFSSVCRAIRGIVEIIIKGKISP